MNSAFQPAIPLAFLLLLVGEVSFIGCNRGESNVGEKDYAARHVRVKEIRLGEVCRLGSMVYVEPGAVIVRIEFIGDEETIETTSHANATVKLLDSHGNVLHESHPEMLFQRQTDVFVFDSVFHLEHAYSGAYGCIELLGSNQSLLVRKNFQVK